MFLITKYMFISEEIVMSYMHLSYTWKEVLEAVCDVCMYIAYKIYAVLSCLEIFFY